MRIFLLVILLYIPQIYSQSKDADEAINILKKSSELLNNPKEILNKSIEACKSLQSVQYQIKQTNRYPNKAWFPEIEAIITQKKDFSIENVGFSNALILAKGRIKEKGKSNEFFFSFNGNTFTYHNTSFGKVKKINNPSRSTIMGLLQQHLYMLRLSPFMDLKPFGDKHNNGNYKLDRVEAINGELCYKLSKILTMTNQNTGKQSKYENFWWISTNDFLPRAFMDVIHKKEILILSKNKDFPNTYFNTNSSEKIDIENLTNIEAGYQFHKKNLLSIGSKVPKWEANGYLKNIYNSKKLEGKVVLIDFWGTWCTPCIKAMPMIQKLKNYYKENEEVVIIGVSAKERNEKDSKNYFNSKNYSYIHIPNGDNIAVQFGVVEYPTLYIIDKKGNIVHSEKGFNDKGFEQWKKIIKNLL